ncbi:molybdopterin-guanine dinucleotide biosynthesis protein B [Niallia sp. Krafla_26]|uniref:molybdopterin-guanine dinucleotide biosynthesis protein B n=1 Tax=Niallia sp. Krafla_26 TaxID=3064703 RepID=UPI003D178415
MVEPFIFQIVGYQNSGKTTFINHLITKLKLLGIRTATIKHHGHGGKPEIVEKKDSSSHITAGALASLVEGEGRLLLQIENCETDLADQIQLISMIKPNLILIEGHKHEPYPKAVFIRNQKDTELLKKLKGIELVLYQDEFPETDMVCFQRDDSKAIQWLIDYLRQQIQWKKADPQ